MYKNNYNYNLPKIRDLSAPAGDLGGYPGFKNILNTQKLLKLHFNSVAWYIIHKVLNFNQEIFQFMLKNTFVFLFTLSFLYLIYVSSYFISEEEEE